MGTGWAGGGHGVAAALFSSGHVWSRSGKGQRTRSCAVSLLQWRRQSLVCMGKLRQRCEAKTTRGSWPHTGLKARSRLQLGWMREARLRMYPLWLWLPPRRGPGWGCLFLALDSAKGRKGWIGSCSFWDIRAPEGTVCVLARLTRGFGSPVPRVRFPGQGLLARLGTAGSPKARALLDCAHTGSSRLEMPPGRWEGDPPFWPRQRN